jgi:hypothetical protein
MAARAKDPTPDEILETCRHFRLNWNEEEREEALSYAPAAAITDAADAIFLESLERGEHLTHQQCLEAQLDASNYHSNDEN